MYKTSNGAGRGNAREPKFLFVRKTSNSLDKWRRHKNKMRIWRRAVKRLSIDLTKEVIVDPVPA